MEQDVQGKNRLAAISPSVTTNMGMKNLRKELIRMRQENRTEQSSHSVQQQSQSSSYNSTDDSSSSQSLAPNPRSQSPTRIHRILTEQSVVANEEILLRFLLADRLDAEKAARRLIEYYSLATELFGDPILLRPILLGDLNRQEQKLLESGWIQLLLTRDTTGRRIMTIDEAGAADPSNISHKVGYL
jgi:hypothetical protein